MMKHLGDFQTPPELVAEVLNCLPPVGRTWPRVLEPTCGSGGFIQGLIHAPSPPREIQGLELQDAYVERVHRMVAASESLTKILVQKADIFHIDLGRDIRWRESGPLLVIGNPPWVTNAKLGALASTNLPRKSNIKGLPGIDALTGSSNFDIAEYIWIKLIRELADQQPTMALLCKTSVARKVLQFACDRALPIASAWMRRIDAKKYFNAATEACLFYVEVRRGKSGYQAPVFKDLRSAKPERILGALNGRLISDLTAYRRVAFADGKCPLIWRQGVKHDAAQILELYPDDRGFHNKMGESVDVEASYVYPLLKSSDLFHGACEKPRLSLIIPQRDLREDTRGLAGAAPKLWNYLIRHASRFARRKSSIYRGRPPFAIFGIGDYSFAPFKVAVSGFYKDPRFRVLGPVNGQPVMLDDTCYFIPCSSAAQATRIASVLNHPLTRDLISSTTFWDAKRPITKSLLQRIDLVALLRRIGYPPNVQCSLSEARNFY